MAYPSAPGYLQLIVTSLSKIPPLTNSLTFLDLQELMKGYISRGHATVVLSKKGAFPGTGV